MWVVDAVSDFVLGTFWSVYFYLCVITAIAVCFYSYVRVVVFIFCSYLEVEIRASDIFVW